jgi:hypothetical protein
MFSKYNLPVGMSASNKLGEVVSQKMKPGNGHDQSSQQYFSLQYDLRSLRLKA